ncbi:MAG: putative two-component system response regulator [Marmoricola sp.]|jgi:NarL family two-component system response regulator LiaR|nr:putative two-component system response regulator [Marmoricola sp.]
MDDYAVVVAGLRALLEPYEDRVQVVELDSQMDVESDIDVLLYDGFSRERVVGPVREVIASTPAPVVLFTWHLGPEMVSEALENGMAGCVSKTASAEELIEALEQVHRGAVVVSQDPGPDAAPAAGEWPGRSHGLTARESEVMALIAQGLTNPEIAERAYISPNTVKSYIRSAYRRIGVERRSQAVLWATQNGFLPDHKRTIVVPDDGTASGSRTERVLRLQG